MGLKTGNQNTLAVLYEYWLSLVICLRIFLHWLHCVWFSEKNQLTRVIHLGIKLHWLHCVFDSLKKRFRVIHLGNLFRIDWYQATSQKQLLTEFFSRFGRSFRILNNSSLQITQTLFKWRISTRTYYSTFWIMKLTKVNCFSCLFWVSWEILLTS